MVNNQRKTSFLYFLSIGVKLHFYSLGTICEENMRVSRGMQSHWLWVSNRGEQHPCWHKVSKGKQRCPWQGYPKGTASTLAHDFP